MVKPKISNAKIEIDGKWYETKGTRANEYCSKCDIKQYCGASSEILNLCMAICKRAYFKKVDSAKASLKEARFFHG